MNSVGTHDPAGGWIRNRDEDVRARIAVTSDAHKTLLVVSHCVEQGFVQGLLRHLGVYFRKVSRNVTHACDGAVLEKTRVVVLGALCLVGAPRVLRQDRVRQGLQLCLVGAPRVLRKDFVCDGMSVSIFLLLHSRTPRIVRGVLYHGG